ncbi:MAG: DUF924 family protein [Gammaproteobacteria bacterium]|nr:DUF924 family protein [Gammaproteobacteria bacterium]
MKPIEIIDFWYADPMRKHWFSSTPELDNQIRDRYEKVWIESSRGEYDEWQNTPEGSLALVIVLDQFPLNMFRGEAKSFQTEKKAIEVALSAINRGFDKKLEKNHLSFLFMPLMHSENIDHQELSVELFKKYELKDNITFAEHHRDIVKKYGRFPHRNQILGRESSEAEIEYLSSENAFKG